MKLAPLSLALLVSGFLTVSLSAGTYDSWKASNFTSTEQSDTSVSSKGADPDGDGITNLLEYAFALNPKQADSSGLPVTELPGDSLTLTFRFNPSAGELLYFLESSNNLKGWVRHNDYAVLSEEDQGTFSLLTIQDPVLASAADKRFIRLAVLTSESASPYILLAPTQLSSDGIIPVTLNWRDRSTIEAGYIVERKESVTGAWEELGATAADTSSYEDGTAVVQKDYFYRVAALQETGIPGVYDCSDYSNEIEVAPQVAMHPESVTGQWWDATSILLQWLAWAPGTDLYRIERWDPDNGWMVVTTLNGNLLEYLDMIGSGGLYNYRVVALDGSGEILAIGTLNPAGLAAAPLAAENVRIYRKASGDLLLFWEDRSGNEDGFVIERSDDEGQNWIEVATAARDATFAVIPAASAGSASSLFNVTPTNASGSSPSVPVNHPAASPPADPNHDEDKDGLTDVEEAELETDPGLKNPDADDKEDPSDSWAHVKAISLPRLPEVRYAVIDLKTTTATGAAAALNNKGWVVSSKGALWNPAAAEWSAPIQFPTAPAKPSTYGTLYEGAAAINDDNHTIGSGVYYQNGLYDLAGVGFYDSTVLKINDAGGGTTGLGVGTWSSYYWMSQAIDINNAGVIAGGACNEEGTGAVLPASRTAAGQWNFVDLPEIHTGSYYEMDGKLTAINEAGHSIGSYAYLHQENLYWFFYDGTPATKLPKDYSPVGLTDNDEVILAPNSNSSKNCISLWRKGAKVNNVQHPNTMTNLEPSVKRGTAISNVNNRLQMVGTLNGEGVVVHNGRTILINSLIPSEWQAYPYKINENGTILATAYKQGEPAAKSVLLVPVELEWIAVGSNANVSDNKTPVATNLYGQNVPANAWMPAKGSRIFPDKKTPTDTTPRNKAKLQIKIPGLPGHTVYLRALDVDDPTPDAFDHDDNDNRVIDPLDGEDDPKGDDNIADPQETPNTGRFVSSGSDRMTVVLDNQGEGEVDFEVGMQPGNNYRVAVAIVAQTDLNVLQISDKTENGYAPAISGKQATGFNGVLSSTLTVWRHVVVEQDSMEAIPAPMSSPDRTVTRGLSSTSTNWTLNSPENGKSTIRVNGGSLPGILNFYEYGRIKSGTTEFRIRSSTAGSILGSEIVIDGVPSAQEQALFDHQDFEVYDDDGRGLPPELTPLLPRLDLINDVVKSKFIPAYIELIDAASLGLNPNKTVPFSLNENIGDPYASTVVNDADDLGSHASDVKFWNALVTAAYQAAPNEDEDPFDIDGNALEGLTVSGIGFPTYSGIFLEGIRDVVGMSLIADPPLSGSITLLHKEIDKTVAHEIGHLPGDGNAIADHNEYGLMGANLSVDEFVAQTIRRFRSATKWR